jgi:hypothetical protein
MIYDMGQIRFSSKSIPLIFSLLAIAAYGPFLPWIGLYWDDWPFIWSAHFFGPGGFIDVFQHSRPLLWPIAFFTTSFIPENPVAWQIFGLFVRILTALSSWYCFKSIWPRFQRQALMAGLFFLVYPGFSQQWIPLTYVNQLYIPLIAYTLSLGMMSRAVRTPKNNYRLTLCAILLQIVGLFSTEYFFGLEFLRPIIIWYSVQDVEKTFLGWLKFIMKYWLPYLSVLTIDISWLMFYYRFGEYRYYDLRSLDSLGASVWEILLNLVKDSWEAVRIGGIEAWVQTFNIFWKKPDLLWALIGLVLVSFLSINFFLARLDLPSLFPKNRRWAWRVILIALVGILLGRIPSWAAGLPLRLSFGWDRFTLPMIFGASMLFIGLVELSGLGSRGHYIISLVISLSIGQQFINASTFRDDWDHQKELFWQLSWRIPALEPHTILLTNELPLTYETDNSLTAPLNWIYSSSIGDDLPYILLYSKIRLGGPKLPDIKPNLPIIVKYANITFTGSTSDLIAFYEPPLGCLKILDSTYSNAAVFPELREPFIEAIELSDTSRILIKEPSPTLPSSLFGEEPSHTWCYYFEKAELARQSGDWNSVVVLISKALEKGFAPKDPREWLPLIEGYAHTNNLLASEELSNGILREYPQMHHAICNIWKRVESEADYHSKGQKKAITLLNTYNCHLY